MNADTNNLHERIFFIKAEIVNIEQKSVSDVYRLMSRAGEVNAALLSCTDDYFLSMSAQSLLNSAHIVSSKISARLRSESFVAAKKYARESSDLFAKNKEKLRGLGSIAFREDLNLQLRALAS